MVAKAVSRSVKSRTEVAGGMVLLGRVGEEEEEEEFELKQKQGAR